MPSTMTNFHSTRVGLSLDAGRIQTLRLPIHHPASEYNESNRFTISVRAGLIGIQVNQMPHSQTIHS